MDIAQVRGQCTATVKDSTLDGHRLTLVQRVSPIGEPEGPVEVALDTTSAAPGQLVLLARGSSARIPASIRQVATDLTVVAILDEVTVATTQTRAGRPRRRTSSIATEGR